MNPYPFYLKLDPLPLTPAPGQCPPAPEGTALASERRVPRGARVRDHVADVGHAGDIGHQALETEAKAGVRHGAVAAEIAVPAVVLRIQAELRHARVEDVQAFLALAAADDLADAGREHVHRRDRLAAVRLAVLAHVERLDRARVVVDGDRALEVLLGEVALVLGLEVGAPRHGILPSLAAFLEDRDGFRVAAALEGALEHEVEAREQVLVDELGEKLEVGGAVFLRVADQVLHERLGEVHVARQVAEGDLGLDHPELGGVARGVAVLGAEGRAEGVDVGERVREDLALELAGDGEEGLLAEEILRVVHVLVLAARRVLEVERRHAEHVARALGVAGRDDRRVDVVEAAFLEELVDGVGEAAAHAEDGAEEIRPRAEVGDLAEELEGVALLLERVGVIGLAEHGEFFRHDLPFLAAALGFDELAMHLDGGTGVGAGDVGVVGQRGVHDDLQALQAGAVVELDEREGLGVAAGADPALEEDGVGRGGGVEGVLDESA